MNKQWQVVIILLMLFVHKTDTLILQYSTPNPRVLEASKKSSRQQSHPRKLYREDYEKSLGSLEDYAGFAPYDKISQYLTLAMGAMILINTLNPGQPLKTNRRTAQLKKQSSKLAKAMKGKSITDFLSKQHKDMEKFLQKRQRKLKVEDGKFGVKLAEQFISKQFKIPINALKVLQPVARSLFGLIKKKAKKETNDEKNKKSKENKKKRGKSEDND